MLHLLSSNLIHLEPFDNLFLNLAFPSTQVKNNRFFSILSGVTVFPFFPLHEMLTVDIVSILKVHPRQVQHGLVSNAVALMILLLYASTRLSTIYWHWAQQSILSDQKGV